MTAKSHKTHHKNIDQLLRELNRPQRFPWLAPWRMPLVVTVIGLCLFIPMRARWAYLWDSVEFALAIQHFDVSLSQPHPPGYFLYVMLGRLLDAFVGDPHTTLLWISILSGAVLAGMLTKLGTDLFGNKSVGSAAGFLAVTSPLIWFFSSVALTYVVEALLATIFVWWCWHAIRRGGTWVDTIGLGLFLAVISGVSLPSLPALLPLALYTASRFRSARPAKVVGLIAVAVGGIALWFSQMLAMTGGLDAYWVAAKRTIEFHAHKTLLGGGFDALRWNIYFAAIYCLNGLMAGAVVLLVAMFKRLLQRQKETATPPSKIEDGTSDARSFLALWILPPVILGILLGYTKTQGHVFGYLPGLILLIGAILGRIRNASKRYTLVSICCAVNLFAFLGWPAAWDKVFDGKTCTDRALRAHDRLIHRLVTAIDGQFDPDKTRILYQHGDLYLGLRHLQWYLPRFTHVQTTVDRAMVPEGQTRYLAVVDGKTRLIEKVLSDRPETILLVIPHGTDPKPFGQYIDLSLVNPVEGTGDILWMGSHGPTPQ